MLAGLERGDGNLGVQVPGNADVNGVDLRVLHEGPPVGLHPADAEPVGERLGCFLVAAADRCEDR